MTKIEAISEKNMPEIYRELDRLCEELDDLSAIKNPNSFDAIRDTNNDLKSEDNHDMLRLRFQ